MNRDRKVKYMLKQVKLQIVTKNALDDALKTLEVGHNSRNIVRADILAECVRIALKQVVNEMK